MRFADEATHNRIHAEASRLAHRHSYAPRCDEDCGRRMRMDSFNGMWICSRDDHGGYQTQDQVARLIYVELLESEGFDV